MTWNKKNKCIYNKVGCMHPTDRKQKCQYKTCIKFEV